LRLGIVYREVVVVYHVKTKDETDFRNRYVVCTIRCIPWPKPTPINEKPIQAKAPNQTETKTETEIVDGQQMKRISLEAELGLVIRFYRKK
jgi:hypothetical protein